MTKLTQHEQAAKMMRDQLGVSEPNCFDCIWYGGEKDGMSQCNSVPGIAVMKFIKTLRSDPAKAHLPFFPVVTFPDPKGEEFTVGAIIAHEAGYGLGQMAWPDRYNPVFILFCLFYSTQNEIENQEHSDIDKDVNSM